MGAIRAFSSIQSNYDVPMIGNFVKIYFDTVHLSLIIGRV